VGCGGMDFLLPGGRWVVELFSHDCSARCSRLALLFLAYFDVARAFNVH
jgi:hypothetical protein